MRDLKGVGGQSVGGQKVGCGAPRCDALEGQHRPERPGCPAGSLVVLSSWSTSQRCEASQSRSRTPAPAQASGRPCPHSAGAAAARRDAPRAAVSAVATPRAWPRGSPPRGQGPAQGAGTQQREGRRGAFWLRALGLTSQEGAGRGGCCLSTRCGRHTRAPSRASDSGQDTGLEPIGEETPVTSLGRQVPGGGSGPAVGHVPLLPPPEPLPGARKGAGFRIPGLATQPPSGTPAQSPGAPLSNLVPPQGRLIQGILS